MRSQVRNDVKEHDMFIKSKHGKLKLWGKLVIQQLSTKKKKATKSRNERKMSQMATYKSEREGGHRSWVKSISKI